MDKALLFVLGAGLAVVALLAINRRDGVSLAQSVGEAAGGAVVDTATGVVYGVGDAVGVPRTNMTECERAIAEGRTWDASFVCPAGTFIKHVLG